jgi:hypothetical protein
MHILCNVQRWWWWECLCIFSCASGKRDFLYVFTLPRHRFDECAELLHNWQDFLWMFAVRVIIHMLKILYTSQSWMHYYYVYPLCVCEKLFNNDRRDNDANPLEKSFCLKFSSLPLSDFILYFCDLETIFFILQFERAILYNVNWSTISEWLDEIKVDVNDLIWNLQYIACKKFEIREYFFPSHFRRRIANKFKFGKCVSTIWIFLRM